MIPNASNGRAPVLGGKSGRRNINKINQREREEYKIGKSVQIIKGFWKGKIGIIVDGTATHRDIELHSRNKTVTVQKNEYMEVYQKDGEVVNKDVMANYNYTPMGSTMSGQTPSQFGGQTPHFGGGGMTPGFAMGGMTPNLGGTGGLTPGFTGGNEGDWDTPKMQTPSATPMVTNNYDQGMMTSGGGYNQFGNYQAPSSSGWGGNNSSSINQSQQYSNNGSTAYGQPGMSSFQGNVGPPSTVGGYTPSDNAGHTPSDNNSYINTPASLIGGNSTPSVGQTDDIDDEAAWGTPPNPSTFAGLLLTLKMDESVQLELVRSLVDQPRIHVVRHANGQEENMHENMLATVVPGKDDRIVVLDPEEEEFGKRGVVKNKEEEDYIVTMDGSIDGVIIVEANVIGKVKA